MKQKNDFNHISVRLEDSIEALNIKENQIYVDCTFGRGGHSKKILEKLNNTGHLYCFDQDLEAQNYFEKNFKQYKNCTLIKSNFVNIKSELKKLNINNVDGILFDLGVSSPMFDNPDRGFSFRFNSKLDMRMNQESKLSAYDVINSYSKEQLNLIFKKYGEISQPQYVVNAILKAREIKAIETTFELIEIIKNNIPKKMLFQKKHFATTYFQAIRIEVNDELNILKKSLEDALSILNINGRIVTISFHSLEEKIIKTVYYETMHQKNLPKEIPINNINNFKIIKINKKVNDEELKNNNRARSSYLKIIERIC